MDRSGPISRLPRRRTTIVWSSCDRHHWPDARPCPECRKEAAERDSRQYQQWWVMREIGDVIPLPYPEQQQPYRGMLYMRREDRLHHDWTPDLHDASAVGDTGAQGFTGFTPSDFAY